jgi:hypothetical protein
VATKKTVLLYPAILGTFVCIAFALLLVSCGGSADKTGSAPEEKLAIALSWIRSQPTEATSVLGTWSYGNEGKDARFDYADVQPSGDRIVSGPYWAIDGTYYWANGNDISSISWTQIAERLTDRELADVVSLVAVFSLGDPYRILLALDPASLSWSDDKTTIEGRALVRDILLLALPVGAADVVEKDITSEFMTVQLVVGETGEPVSVTCEMLPGPAGLVTYRWTPAEAAPIPPEGSTPVISKSAACQPTMPS